MPLSLCWWALSAAHSFSGAPCLLHLRPTPGLVRISFWVFVVTLLLAGTALILGMPIFPWDLNPNFLGCIWLHLFRRCFLLYLCFASSRWGNALGQLLSFLAYDLVLIVPFLLLLESVKPWSHAELDHLYCCVLYSGGLAIHYLFLNPQTRFGSLLKDERLSAD